MGLSSDHLDVGQEGDEFAVVDFDAVVEVEVDSLVGLVAEEFVEVLEFEE